MCAVTRYLRQKEKEKRQFITASPQRHAIALLSLTTAAQGVRGGNEVLKERHDKVWTDRASREGCDGTLPQARRRATKEKITSYEGKKVDKS